MLTKRFVYSYRPCFKNDHFQTLYKCWKCFHSPKLNKSWSKCNSCSSTVRRKQLEIINLKKSWPFLLHHVQSGWEKPMLVAALITAFQGICNYSPSIWPQPIVTTLITTNSKESKYSRYSLGSDRWSIIAFQDLCFTSVVTWQADQLVLKQAELAGLEAGDTLIALPFIVKHFRTALVVRKIVTRMLFPFYYSDI